MLQEILNKDIIVDYLLRKASFTKPQLDTLLINLLKDDELNLDSRTSLRDEGKVSKGSFIRTLRQAQKNLEKSLYTIIISEYLSILDENNFSSLIRIGEILKEVQTQRINVKEAQSILNQVSSAISSICKKSSAYID